MRPDVADLWLAARSLFWTLLVPGVVAGVVPWHFFGVGEVRLHSPGARTVAALAVVASGLAILVATVWQFAHTGRGTLSPADPPRALVVKGLYRYVRNPMYLGVTLLLLGQAALVRRLDLALYWAVWFAAVNVFVIRYEEPRLRRQVGDAYDRYCRRVGRWIPRFGKSPRRRG